MIGGRTISSFSSVTVKLYGRIDQLCHSVNYFCAYEIRIVFLNTLHTARKILYLLTFTYLLKLLTCSTAKDHETSNEDSSADFVIFFQFGVVCVLRFGLKNVGLLLMYT